MTNPPDKAFAIRRLNPFDGLLQVVTTADARALSSNGRNWEIQVLSDSPKGLWANIPFAGQRFYTFGLWSAADGLHRVPLNPLFNIRGMLESAQGLIGHLGPRTEELPFPLTDRYELWLLDETSGRPIALLESARSAAELDHKTGQPWTAAAPGDLGFVSQQLLQQGLPVNDGHNPRLHATRLERLVRGRGARHQTWYLRNTDDSGGRALAQEQPDQAPGGFPELPISLDWENAEERRLIMDYVAWKAPQLLLLPDLSAATRAMLEGLAVKNAVQIDRLWRLLPEIHDKPLLNKARVEARIRLSNQT